MAVAIVLTIQKRMIQKPDRTKSGSFFRFQMVFDKMGVICPDFKWFGFRILDTIRNPDHLQSNLFLTIQNQD